MRYLTTGYHPDFERLLEKIEYTYGFEMFNLDGIGEQLNITKFNKNFFKNKSATADISVDGNSNVSDRSVVSYNPEQVKPINRLNSYYMLWKQLRKLGKYKMADEVVEDNITGRLYINDFHGYGSSIPYCFNYSTYDLVVQGLNMVNNLKCEPPKHLFAFKSQLEQFVIIASNSTLGATGLADLLITVSIYVENILETLSDSNFNFKDTEDAWKYVFEIFVSMIYTFNQPMRASQSPFTNVGVYDDNFLKELIPNYINPKTMKPVGINTVKDVQGVFLDAMNHVMSRTVVTFPVVTACFSLDDNKIIKDEEFLDMITMNNSKYYFINLYGGSESTLSSCCRLRSDMMNEYFNSFGAGGSKIGSLGVCTINLPRTAYEFESKEYSLNLIKELAEKAFYVNYTKRLLLKERIDGGKHPLYTLGYIDEKKQYGTIGFNGFNEYLEILGIDPLSDYGIEVGKEVLETINKVNDRLGVKYTVPVNLEQIPAEGVSVKLAKKDQYLGYNEDYDLYSNQFIPLTVNADLLDRIHLQGIYDTYCSGGSILHINDSADETSKEYDSSLTKYIFNKGVVYFARNKLLKVCKNGHVTTGRVLEDGELVDFCPICKAPIESNWTRVVGFITQVDNWIKERREKDFPNREFYGTEEIKDI